LYFDSHFVLQPNEFSYQLLKLGGLKVADTVSLAEKLVNPIRSLLLNQLDACSLF
jgi:hypothetical protein